jgi:hypothetical protein
MGERLFTDKLVLRWLEVLDAWSLDSATPVILANPVHESGSPKLSKPGAKIGGVPQAWR